MICVKYFVWLRLRSIYQLTVHTIEMLLCLNIKSSLTLVSGLVYFYFIHTQYKDSYYTYDKFIIDKLIFLPSISLSMKWHVSLDLNTISIQVLI